MENFRARIEDRSREDNGTPRRGENGTVSQGAFTIPLSVLLVSKCSRPLEPGTVVVVITSMGVDYDGIGEERQGALRSDTKSARHRAH